METDADRLATIQALGGREHVIDGRAVWSIFDDTPIESLDSPGVDVRVPILTCRTSDVSGLAKDVPVDVGQEAYRVKRAEPNSPAPGWTILRLKR